MVHDMTPLLVVWLFSKQQDEEGTHVQEHMLAEEKQDELLETNLINFAVIKISFCQTIKKAVLD